MPGQQSADVVQPLPVGTQEVAAHLLSMQGLPQQSALVAQTVFAGTGVAQLTGRIKQRGMPSASLLQQFSGLLWQ
jgi:hypothetical protein